MSLPSLCSLSLIENINIDLTIAAATKAVLHVVTTISFAVVNQQVEATTSVVEVDACATKMRSHKSALHADERKSQNLINFAINQKTKTIKEQ